MFQKAPSPTLMKNFKQILTIYFVRILNEREIQSKCKFSVKKIRKKLKSLYNFLCTLQLWATLYWFFTRNSSKIFFFYVCGCNVCGEKGKY